MKKICAFLLCCAGLVGCSKHDPILPGVRHDVFDSSEVVITNQSVPDLSQQKNIYGDDTCEYRQDLLNNIWLGDKKVFDGFATESVVKTNRAPVCDGRFVYAGLSDGQVVKINTNNNKVVWTADVFKGHSMTGGTAVVDIVARIGVDGKSVLAGGLGDAWCKLRADNGTVLWCLDISVPLDFIVVDNFAFVVGADNNLYAVNVDTGRAYWKAEVKKQVVPSWNGVNIVVGKQKFNYHTGEIIK